MRKISLALIAVVAASLALASCANTVTGVGKDVKSTARAVQHAVQ